jgi:DNA-binding NarL/FixJ family response regulator
MSATAVAGWNGTPQHGTRTRYAKGCRCEPCREAKRVNNRKRYENKGDLRRRRDEVLRLAGEGWPAVEIARVTGLSSGQVSLMLAAWG